MAFPAVQSTSVDRTTTTNTTAHAITLPSGVTAGDLLVCVFSVDGNPTTLFQETATPGWIKLGQASNTTVATGAVYWKIAGAVGNALTIDTSATEQSSHHVYRIGSYGYTLGSELWDDGSVTLGGGASYNSGTDTYTLNRNGGTSDFLLGPVLTSGNTYLFTFDFSHIGTESFWAIDLRGCFSGVIGAQQILDAAAGSYSLVITASSTEAVEVTLPDAGWGAGYTGLSIKQITALPISGTSANGSSTNANPPSHNAGGSARDILWLATASIDSTVVASVAPSSFTNLLTHAAAGTGGASTSSARREVNGTTLDPGTFTTATEQWVAWTLAIEPAAGGPTTVTETPSETAAVSGTDTQNVVVNNDASETAAAGESKVNAVVVGEAVAESSAATDDLADTTVRPEAQTESATPGESYADATVFVEAMAESLAAVDEYVDDMIGQQIIEETPEESIAVSDDPTQQVVVGDQLSESAGANDEAADAIVALGSILESVAAADSFVDAVVHAEVHAEPLAAGDSYLDEGGTEEAADFTFWIVRKRREACR